jgi:mandelate racemase
MNPEGAAAEAEEALALGFVAIKVKVGRGDLAADLDTIRAVRRTVGDKMKLMVDYNQSLSVAEATDRVRARRGGPILDRGTHPRRRLRRACPHRASGENGHPARRELWGPHDVAMSIAAGASDHIMLDVMKLAV